MQKGYKERMWDSRVRGNGAGQVEGGLGPGETFPTHQPLAVVCPGKLNLGCGWSFQGSSFWEGLDCEP